MSTSTSRRPDVDSDWDDLIDQYEIRPDTVYLNQGSFGISPRPVREVRRAWIDRLDHQPMDFYVRQFEGHMESALGSLARFLHTDPQNLVFSENATSAMNVVANSLVLKPGDQVLSNNHEYGAVHRIWQRACDQAKAELRVARLPESFESHDQIVDSIFAEANDRTRLIVVSHITSATALIMPVQAICERAKQLGIPVAIDGPHAPAHVHLDLSELGCAFYTASCHKWLAATLGSGFLFVHPDYQDRICVPNKSWGRLLPAMPEKWFEEFIWPGTRDPSSYFSIPAAIEFIEEVVGLEAFRARTRHMQKQTTEQLVDLLGNAPIGKDIDLWYGTMSHVALPDGDWSHLKEFLWQEGRIEIPIFGFENKWYVRASHYLYNSRDQYDLLIRCLKKALAVI